VSTRLRRTALALLATPVAVLTLGVGTASAHVTVKAPGAEPGGFGEVTFSVPSESDTARTTSLRVQLPTDKPFAFVSVKPVPGWTAKAVEKPLATPITTDDGTVTQAVSEVTWTADAAQGLTPGQYQTFSLSVGPLPEGASTLAFPALQGYDDGSTVAWVDPTVAGQPEPEHPAPTLSLTAGDTAGGATEATAAPAPAAADNGADNGDGLAVTALAVGGAGLLVGAAGVALAVGARRRTAGAPVAGERERDSVGV
jgi:uncharacterized protein YcnI